MGGRAWQPGGVHRRAMRSRPHYASRPALLREPVEGRDRAPSHGIENREILRIVTRRIRAWAFGFRTLARLPSEDRPQTVPLLADNDDCAVRKRAQDGVSWVCDESQRDFSRPVSRRLALVHRLFVCFSVGGSLCLHVQIEENGFAIDGKEHAQESQVNGTGK